MVYPKSDEQRERLAESVKHILLFRALDKVSWLSCWDLMYRVAHKMLNHLNFVYLPYFAEKF